MTAEIDMSNGKLAERQRFEKWMSDVHPLYMLHLRNDGEYVVAWVQIAWEGWQAHAAEAAQAQAQSVPGKLAEPVEGALNYEQKTLFAEGWNACRDAMLAAAPHPQTAQDAKLPSAEDFRLHLGELTPAELRVAQAAARYVLAGTARDAKDAARYRFAAQASDGFAVCRWDDRAGPEGDGEYIPIDDEDVDAAMAKESGR